MTSLQRVLATLHFQHPDRVPFFEQGVASPVASAILGRQAHTGGGGFRRLGVEAAIAGPQAQQEYTERHFEDWGALIEALDFDVVTPTWAGGGVPTKKLDDHTYLFGDLDAVWSIMRYDPPSDSFYTLDSSWRHEKALPQIEEEIQNMEAHHADRKPPTPQAFGLLPRFIQRYGRRRAVAGGAGLGIPMEPAWWEALMVMPDRIRQYLSMQADLACDQIETMARMGVHLIWGGGDLASNQGPVYSPAQFRRFMLEPLKRITACCHKHGLPYCFRTDGLIWPIAQELFVESSVDGYGEIDKQAGMDLAQIRRRLPHLILWGNVDCARTLTFGTPADVASETRACIDAAAHGGGYMLGSSNVIHAHVPPENLLAMADTCRQYGVYPN